MSYAADNEMRLPVYRQTFSKSGEMVFWYLEIRPYLGESVIQPLPTPPGYQPYGRNAPIFYCPAVKYDEAYPHTHYSANAHVFKSPTPLLPDTSDRTSLMKIPKPARTVMYIESIRPSGAWKESSWNFDPSLAKSNPGNFFSATRHSGISHAAFCDGHAEGLRREYLIENFDSLFASAPLWE